MSRAFVKEEQPEIPAAAPPRAALPDGAVNYVTPRGLELLRSEADALALQRAALEAQPEGPERTRALFLAQQRKNALDERIASARLVEAPSSSDEVRFGATVSVRAEGGALQRYRIVGVDEAEPSHGLIAFVSPLARALLGRRAGEIATLRRPRGEEELEVVAISYDSATPSPE